MSAILSYEHKNPIVWILGPPSSGKFTQYKEVASKYDCIAINSRHLPSPNIMFLKGEDRNRLEWEKVKEDLDFNAFKYFNASMTSMTLMTWLQILRSSLKAVFTNNHHHSEFECVIVENYPKSLKQAKELQPPDLIIHLNATDTVCQERAKKAGKCGPKGYDAREMERRLYNYHQNTEPIFDHDSFKEKYIKIDASKSKEKVARDIVNELRKIGIKKRIKKGSSGFLAGCMLGACACVCLDAGCMLGACGIIAAQVLDVVPEDVKDYMIPLAAVSGLVGISLMVKYA